MKNLLILSSLLLCSIFTFAQGSMGSVNSMSSIALADLMPHERNKHNFEKLPVIGKRYFYDSLFHKGTLQTPTNRFTDEYTYRFDMYARTLEVKATDGKTYFVEGKEVVLCNLYLDNEVVSLINAKVPNGRESSIVQVVYQSPTLQLLRGLECKFNFVKTNTSMMYHDYANELKNDFHYFISKGDSRPFIEVDITAKSFSKFLPNESKYLNQLFQSKGKEELTMTKLVSILRQLDNHINKKSL